MMDGPIDHDEERLAELLRLLPPPPAGWIEAAQELPAARAALGSLVARAEEDAAYRDRVLADLEQALAQSGVEPSAGSVELLRRALEP